MNYPEAIVASTAIIGMVIFCIVVLYFFTK